MAEPVAADLMLGANAPIAPPSEPMASDEEMQEIKMILAWQREAANDRKQHDKEWGERKKAYKGKTWQNEKTADSKSKPEINVVRIVIQTILPILTDANPG